MAVVNTRDMRGWAVKGAEQRLLEIAQEAEAIYQAFPELRDRGGRPRKGSGAEGGGAPAAEDGGAAPAGSRRRRRRRMSAEARARIADAQRRRWAAQRAAAGAPQEGTAEGEPPAAPQGRAPKKR